MECSLSKFDRNTFDVLQGATYIGQGSLGGKATGLCKFINLLKTAKFSDNFSSVEVTVPPFTVIRTDVFSKFMEENDLFEIAASDAPDNRIAQVFQQANLPFDILGDLRAFISKIHHPLAVRSSSMLEDDRYEPFAGIYATKMTPNNQPDTDTRFEKLVQAIKYIYASTYFKAAKDYMQATHQQIDRERMAVIIQNVVGSRSGNRFYPDISGVARSYNFYPLGRTKCTDGVVNLALGLGKTIVDGDNCWSYSPAYPNIGPPYTSTGELIKQTQNEFWAVNMGIPGAYNPLKETEYLERSDLIVAESDNRLKYIASTYDRYTNKLTIGTGGEGPRVLTFAPLLAFKDIPVNELIKYLLKICEETLQVPCEIEFAFNFSTEKTDPAKHHFAFLQVRPMVVPAEEVHVTQQDLLHENVLLASKSALGNGEIKTVQDVVYVKPEAFNAGNTRQIAAEIGLLNKSILAEKRSYLLIGFGRWGSSDPWLGIPVTWGQISGARVITESMLENMNVTLSQGSHFFHNLTSFQIPYFSVPYNGGFKIDWQWLREQSVLNETEFVRWVYLQKPLLIRVDGRRGYGVIKKS